VLSFDEEVDGGLGDRAASGRLCMVMRSHFLYKSLMQLSLSDSSDRLVSCGDEHRVEQLRSREITAHLLFVADEDFCSA
jgi:hypothetical protein